MDDTRFRLDLNLRTLSMVSIAAKLWDAPDIKSKIRSYFSERRSVIPNKNWYEITNLILHRSEYMELPTTVLIRLRKIIIFLGGKIHGWVRYVTRELGLDFSLTEKIYWSSYGAVDEIKIFDLYWREVMSAPDFKTDSEFLKFFKLSPVFSLACMFSCEKFINDHKNEMLDELSNFCPGIRTGDTLYNVIVTSVCLALKRVRMAVNLDNIFIFCSKAGFSKVARFYWERLGEFQKISNLCTLVSKCSARPNLMEENFIREKRCEILIFLINQMDEKEKLIFFTEYADCLIGTFLPVWPYQKLIIKLLECNWNIKSSRLYDLLRFVVHYKKQFIFSECPVENELLFKIFQKIWEYMPNTQKVAFVNYTCDDLFLTFDLATLNLVLNDPSIATSDRPHLFQPHRLPSYERCVIDYAIMEGCVKLVKLEKIHLIDELIEKVLNFSPQPKELLKIAFPKFVKDFIIEDKFKLLDQFLDWVSNSGEERAILKNKTPFIKICRHLTENMLDFELASKFLKWRFETDEEIKIFKEEMISQSFLLNDFNYVRIKSGDISYLKLGDICAMTLEDKNEDINDLTFKKFENTTVLDRGMIVGIKREDYANFEDKFQDDLDLDRITTRMIMYTGTKSGDYIAHNVFNIWYAKCFRTETNNFEEVGNLSEAFIKFYYETDDRVQQFKKNLIDLTSENLPRYLFKKLIKRYSHVRLNGLDAFLKFCLVPSDKMEEAKIRLMNQFEKLMDSYLIDKCDLEVAEFCIDWLYDKPGKDKRAELKKNFINCSNKGALLCVSYMKQFGLEESDEDRFWTTGVALSSWLCQIDDMEKLKSDLLLLDKNPPEWLVFLLDKLSLPYDNLISVVGAVVEKFFPTCRGP